MGDAEEVSGYPCEGAGGMGEPRGDEEPPTEVYAEQPELNAWISPYGARGGIGVAGAERMINPPAKVLARRRTGLCRTPPAGIYLNPVQKVHYYWLQIISCNG